MKSTKLIERKRVKQTLALLLIGTRRCDIVDSLSKEWKCSERNVDYYIRKAYDEIHKEIEGQNKEMIQSRFNQLYIDAYRGRPKPEARKVLESISRLAGYITEKSEITINSFKTNWGNESDQEDTTI